MSQNFYDGYIRNNPRRNAKCNTILYRDNYKPYFKSNLNYNLTNENLCEVEHFEDMNPQNNIQIVNNNNIKENNNNNKNNRIEKNSTDLDNHSYLTKLECQNGMASLQFKDTKKMYDISPKSLMKKQIIGDIEEIDRIHNHKIKNTMNYEDMKILHLKNSILKIHHVMNPKMLHAHQRSFMGEPFFQDN